MARRYSNIAVRTTLTAAAAVGDATLTVGDTTGWPAPGTGDVGVAAIDATKPGTLEVVTYTGKTATTLTGVTRGLDGTSARAHAADVAVHHVVSAPTVESSNRRHIPLLGATATLTNQAAATAEAFGARMRTSAEVGEGATEWRSMVAVTTAGAPTAVLRVEWAAPDEATWNTVAENLPLDTVGRKRSAWAVIPPAAKAGDVVFRIMGEGGDGVADPSFGSIHVEVR